MKKISDEILNMYMEDVEEFFNIITMADMYLRQNEKDKFRPEVLAKTARQISAYFPRLAVVVAHYEGLVEAKQASVYCRSVGGATDKKMEAINATADINGKAKMFKNLLKWSDKLVDALKKEAGTLSEHQ